MGIHSGYFQILASGILSLTIYTSIYSYLIRTNGIQVRDHKDVYTNAYNMTYYDGFGCYGRDLGKSNSGYCNGVALSYTNIHEHTCVDQANSNNFFHDFLPFKICFLGLFACLALVSIYSILHDWRLLFKIRNGVALKNIKWYPEENMNFLFLSTCIYQGPWKYFFKKYRSTILDPVVARASDKNVKCFLRFCLFPCIILLWVFFVIVCGCIIVFIIVAVVFDLIISAIIVPIALLPTLCLKAKYKCSGCDCGAAYASSYNVAIMRVCVIILSCVLVIVGFTGYHEWKTMSIDYDPKELCRCGCFYMLKEYNLLALLAMGITLLIKNARFLMQWVKRTGPSNQYLYLIQHSLPISIAYDINKSDPVGSMFLDVDEQIKKRDERFLNGGFVNESDDSKAWDLELLYLVRCVLIQGAIGVVMLTWYISMFYFAAENPYQWSRMTMVIIFFSAFAPCELCICFMICSCFHDCCCRTREEKENDHSLDSLIKNATSPFAVRNVNA